MSGPLDRPSFSDPDDLEQSSQDRESRPTDAQPAEPWSQADPWQETRRETPGWDDWPPATPPPDDYYVEPGPSQDLWAESWEDEASALPRAGYEPVTVDEPAFDPAPIADPVAPSEPRETPETPEPFSTEAPSTGPVSPPEPAPMPPAAEPLLPDWLAEPLPGAAEPDAPVADVEPTSPEAVTPAAPAIEPNGPSWLDVGPQYALPPFLETDDDPEVATPDVGPMPEFEAPPAVEPDAEADAEPDAEADALPEADAEPEAVDDWDPDAAVERWRAWEAEADAAVADVPPPAIPVADAPEPAPLWEPDAPMDEAPAAEPTPDAPASDAPAADAPAASEPEDAEEDAWEPSPWGDADESTRVLPTDWTPPPAPVIQPAAEPGGDGLEPTAGEVRTALDDLDTDAEPQPDSTTAEQAVPWLIGLILLLAGMVIVLLALIFAGPQSLGAPSPSPSASLAGLLPSATPEPTATPVPSVSQTPVPTPTPVPAPEWGPLEMIYQGRAAALAPIYLLLHDFTTEDEAVVLAQDPTIDVRRFAWAPDGTVGAGLLADVLVSIEPGESKRNLGEGLMTVTYGADGSTLYAVRITADGSNDVATILEVDFASGDASELASVSYPRPSIGSEPALPEAQFSDDGGTVRLFWMSDASLRLWVLGASTWQIDPESGEITDLEGDELPVLVDPRNTRRISLTAADDNSETTIRYLDADGDILATTRAPGLVSHLRWSRGGDRVVFTVGRTASGGGVLQDLFLWDLEAGVLPTQITNTGAAFGAEWRGASARWEPG